MLMYNAAYTAKCSCALSLVGYLVQLICYITLNMSMVEFRHVGVSLSNEGCSSHENKTVSGIFLVAPCNCSS
jgi:hypothetical protein